MSSTCPTVKIVDPNDKDDYMIINETDFDEKNHQRCDAEKPAKKDEGDPKTVAEVLELSGGNFMTFKKAAKTILGDEMPVKKDDIVAALEAKGAE